MSHDVCNNNSDKHSDTILTFCHNVDLDTMKPSPSTFKPGLEEWRVAQGVLLPVTPPTSNNNYA